MNWTKVTTLLPAWEDPENEDQSKQVLILEANGDVRRAFYDFVNEKWYSNETVGTVQVYPVYWAPIVYPDDFEPKWTIGDRARVRRDLLKWF